MAYFTGTQQQAIDRLRLLVAATADTDATLSDPELEVLLEDARRRDAAGHAPDDEEWSATWNLESAAAAGWRAKAAMVATQFDVDVDGHAFERSQKSARYEQLANTHARRAAAVNPIG